MKKRNLSHTFIYIAFGIIVFIWLVFMFWWLYPYKIVEMKQPYEVLTPEVKQGELLVYRQEYCKYTDKMPTVQRYFVDGLIYSMADVSPTLREGCGQTLTSIFVPRNLPAGDYYMRTVVTYKINPIRTITFEFSTDKFKVIK
jgi:hypothetical protein